MAKGPEARIQKKIQDAIKKEFPASFFFKSHGGPYQQSGIPDLIGVVHGLFIGIEVKTPDKKTNITQLQEHALKLINKAGGLGFVAWSPEQAVNYIKANIEDEE